MTNCVALISCRRESRTRKCNITSKHKSSFAINIREVNFLCLCLCNQSDAACYSSPDLFDVPPLCDSRCRNNFMRDLPSTAVVKWKYYNSDFFISWLQNLSAHQSGFVLQEIAWKVKQNPRETWSFNLTFLPISLKRHPGFRSKLLVNIHKLIFAWIDENPEASRGNFLLHCDEHLFA